MTKTILITAAILLAIGVLIGAFGAHGLKSRVAPDLLQVYKTGVEYHFYHALGLLLIGALSFSMPSSYLNWAALFLFAGILIFSGSLYLLTLTGTRWIGAITPIGGLSFVAGWICLVIAIVKDLPKTV
jgi:uncharacterized membrane protein YgdD (TMEM256/DUF423 family)